MFYGCPKENSFPSFVDAPKAPKSLLFWKPLKLNNLVLEDEWPSSMFRVWYCICENFNMSNDDDERNWRFPEVPATTSSGS